MGLQNDTSTEINKSPLESGGEQIGQSATDLVGFYGSTPQVQPTNAAQAAVTDGSTGTASATSGIQALTSSYNSTLLGNAIATLAAQTNQIRSALVSLGLIKGS